MQNLLDYRLLRREATRSARAKHQLYWTELTKKMEATAHFGNFDKLFRLIRRTSGKQLTPIYAMLADTLSQTLIIKSTDEQNTSNSF